MLKPNSLNASSDTYKVTRATPELLQAACDVINAGSNYMIDDRHFWETIKDLRQALLKAGCVDE